MGYSAVLSKPCVVERPKQLIKLIDLKSGMKSAAVADILINETLHDPVTTEIGYEGESRFSVSLREMVTDGLEQSPLAQIVSLS